MNASVSSAPGRILVVGSLNLDRVASVARLPHAGETALAERLERFSGGKGANQAVAAARLGGRVALCGAVGNDEEGAWLSTQVEAAGVDVSGVLRDAARPTGTAFITVDRNGENQIVVVPGANGGVNPAHASEAAGRLGPGDVLLVQLEIPPDTVAAAARAAREAGATVVLDPAPAPETGTLPDELLACVDWLTPNEHELAVLGRRPERLLGRGVSNVIVTRGAQGATWIRAGEDPRTFDVPRVEATDTTAAGDAFNGALAVGLAAGGAAGEAIGFACRAAAIAVTRRGAQASLPTLGEVGGGIP